MEEISKEQYVKLRDSVNVNELLFYYYRLKGGYLTNITDFSNMLFDFIRFNPFITLRSIIDGVVKELNNKYDI